MVPGTASLHLTPLYTLLPAPAPPPAPPRPAMPRGASWPVWGAKDPGARYATGARYAAGDRNATGARYATGSADLPPDPQICHLIRIYATGTPDMPPDPQICHHRIHRNATTGARYATAGLSLFVFLLCSRTPLPPPPPPAIREPPPPPPPPGTLSRQARLPGMCTTNPLLHASS
jgi:hypothetical protein